MKIEISELEAITLAESFASHIHGFVVQMHLRRTWGIWEDGTTPNPYVNREYQVEQLKRIRRAIRSIRNPWDRKSFVLAVKFCFQKMRTEKCTTIKWQDYVESVKQACADHDARLIKEAK